MFSHHGANGPSKTTPTFRQVLPGGGTRAKSTASELILSLWKVEAKRDLTSAIQYFGVKICLDNPQRLGLGSLLNLE